MKTENTKCGEIFRCDSGKFVFSCSYCTKTFNWYLDALQHIENHFLFGIPSSSTIIDTSGGKEIDLKPFEFIEIQESKIVPKTVEANIKVELATTHDLTDELNHSVPPVNLQPAAADPFKIRKSRADLTKSAWGPTKKRVQCDICKKELRRGSLRNHLKNHVNLREFICSICAKGYNCQTALNNHLKWHTNGFKYNCQFCGFQSRQEGNLNQHLRTHTGEKPYICSVCCRKFGHLRNLTEHLRIHTGERPYKCDICSKSFRSSTALAVHKKIHTQKKDFECNVCLKRFIKNYKLKEHYRKHTGERPYKCDVCNKTFVGNTAYKQHLNVHTGAMPYKCRYCELCFPNRGKRTTHEKHHKKLLHTAAANVPMQPITVGS